MCERTETGTEEIIVKMIEYSDGNLHDINHFMKVYGYARTIGTCEGLSGAEQKTLEIAAVLHDIACPLCRSRYGNTDGKRQEEEGILLARDFLQPLQLPEEMKERVAWLVGHHHTLTGIEGADYQILIEADYLVNADESGYSRENIRNMCEKVFRTGTGKALLNAIYLSQK